MARTSNKIDVYLERGQKRTFVGALDWPGWCRSGRDEPAALQALLEYGPRYARVLQGTRLGFQAPTAATAFKVIERLRGNTTTDFGSPEAAPSQDTQPVDADELRRFQKLLKACWKAFDAAAQTATGKELRKGPRGGGRELEKIIQHVFEADGAYLSMLGRPPRLAPAGRGKLEPSQANDLSEIRESILEALASVVEHGGPERGPRGGIRWKPRYFVRRVAWHVLDHAWEIEDRVTG